MAIRRHALDERFEGNLLDSDVWFPYYLPHWSSRAQTRAAYEVRDGELHLFVPPEQPLWCPDAMKERGLRSLVTAPG
ncbi:hypothetical protein [Pseudofrankia asymbiotica]|uniref:Uncharacterized protein n=1 Tax=Pseudofrankia asymbiotica TaxID=1834516 RepID=A0A1V2HZ85_9ACTN|nr:hypothetical protein [Pseudofrankia asymbiotica]ONH21886.1 hypothetical protein BL253_37520 [Pseudofrankia asymbiotica]